MIRLSQHPGAVRSLIVADWPLHYILQNFTGLLLLFVGEIIFDAMSKGSIHNIRKISAVLVDGLVSIGQQQKVCKCNICMLGLFTWIIYRAVELTH